MKSRSEKLFYSLAYFTIFFLAFVLLIYGVKAALKNGLEPATNLNNNSASAHPAGFRQLAKYDGQPLGTTYRLVEKSALPDNAAPKLTDTLKPAALETNDLPRFAELLAQRVFAKCNEHRQKMNLKPLAWSDKLAAICLPNCSTLSSLGNGNEINKLALKEKRELTHKDSTQRTKEAKRLGCARYAENSYLLRTNSNYCLKDLADRIADSLLSHETNKLKLHRQNIEGDYQLSGIALKLKKISQVNNQAKPGVEISLTQGFGKKL